MRMAVVALLMILVACDHFPKRQFSEIAPVHGSSASSVLEKIVRAGTDVGFVKVNCQTFKYREGDVSAPALRQKSYLLNSDSNAICMQRPKNEKESIYSDAFLVTRKGAGESFEIEIWSLPPERAADMVNLLSAFWHKIGKADLDTKIPIQYY